MHFTHEKADLTEWQSGDWAYEWFANGMLAKVKRPDGREVTFEYDALGRRTAKIYNGGITRFVWDGNVLLHEWKYDVKNRPQLIIDEEGNVEKNQVEPVENLITWVYESGNYVPSAKIIEGQKYSIISDYIGRPIQSFDDDGNLVWSTAYDIYGKLKNLKGNKTFIPFRQLGQYEDEELGGLYYNRYRYYDNEQGNYISKDPIGLDGGIVLYGYVKNVNVWTDVAGLSRDTPAWKARGWQGSGDYPGIDKWETITLKKGTVVYGGIPGQSEFYLSSDSIEASGHIKEKLWKSAQVKPHDTFGYRSQVQAYVLTENVNAGKSKVSANPQHGKGGATQYFIEDFENKMKAVGSPINLKCK